MTDPRPPTETDPAPPSDRDHPAEPGDAGAALETLATYSWRFCHLAGRAARSIGTRLDPPQARRAEAMEQGLRHALAAVCAAVPLAAAEVLIATEERTPEWRHPRNVLPEPSPDLGEVLVASRRLRDRAAAEARGRIERVIAKLETAARIDDNVRRRLQGGARPGSGP